jgi:MAF protein
MRIVLASTSTYRAELLGRLGLEFATRAPGIDESRLRCEQPEELVLRLALKKAESVAAAQANALVIGSDQVAVCNNTILGKPGTAARAREQLATLSGQEVRFLTGLAVVNSASGWSDACVVRTPVTFRHLSEQQIANYVARELPLDCAGSFKSEGLGIALFSAVGGTDPSALIGLPLIELCSMLMSQGVEVLSPRS